MRKVEKSADGSSLSQVTKTDRFTKSGSLFFSFLYLCVNLFLTTQVNKEPIFIYSDVLICWEEKGKKQDTTLNEQ